MNWVKRINSVLDYIEENLDGEIDDFKIASLFASPQGMFQRVFTNITDMTLSEYIRKRRLSQAAIDITKTSDKIIDVAIKYGYNSAAAFSSAFKKHHGVTPSAARRTAVQLNSFHRFAFTLIIAGNEAKGMQYYYSESAEYFLKQMVGTKPNLPWAHSVSEHNGVKCATDGYRAAVILPEGTAEWDLSDAYFETENDEIPRLELNSFFIHGDDSELSFILSKEQAALLLVSLDGAKTDYQRKYLSFSTTEKDSARQEAIVCIDMNKMGIITESTAAALQRQAREPIMAFNVKLIEETLKFIMCSSSENIEIHFNGNLSGLVIKSGRLYAMIFPVKPKDSVA